jgi:hypothetical protein
MEKNDFKSIAPQSGKRINPTSVRANLRSYDTVVHHPETKNSMDVMKAVYAGTKPWIIEIKLAGKRGFGPLFRLFSILIRRPH